jgi:hypothetical protein
MSEAFTAPDYLQVQECNRVNVADQVDHTKFLPKNTSGREFENQNTHVQRRLTVRKTRQRFGN